MRTMFGVRVHAKSVAYAATSLGSSLINPVFTFYYVKVYLNRFHVSEPWFQLAQVIFMIWNAVNDPLFGCLQDNARSCVMLRSRRYSILYGAPLFVAAFILPWFPWADYGSSAPSWLAGIQLTVALCFYDAMFTFVLLAQCALLAELSTTQSDRVRMVQYSQAASLIGSVSVLVCETMSSGLEHYTSFQLTCVGLGVAAGLCFVYTGLNADTQFDHLAKLPNGIPREKAVTAVDAMWTALSQTRQIFAQPSFISFVLMNFCQIYHTTFLANFANIIGDQLLGSGLSQAAKSGLYGTLFVIPQLLVIAAAPVVSRVGYYRVIRASFFFKIFAGLSLLAIGQDHPWLIAAFLVIESANANATFSLFGLCLSDVIDIDSELNQRSHPLSSMVFGLNALVTKPAISVAPMITVALFNRYGYSSHSATPPPSAPSVSPPALPTAAHQDALLTSAMFYATCAVPVVTGLVQLFVWRFYVIRDSHKNNCMMPVVA